MNNRKQDDQVYLRCYICDYSGSSEESLYYIHENEKPMTPRQRISRVVRIDPRDGRAVCSKCEKHVRDINYDFDKIEREKKNKQLESWADQLLKDNEEVKILTDAEILEDYE